MLLQDRIASLAPAASTATPAGTALPWMTNSAITLDTFQGASLVVEFSPDGDIRTASDNLLELLGYTRGEAERLRHRDLLAAEESGKPSYATFWLDRAAGHFLSGVFKHRTKTKQTVWLYASYISTFNRDGQIEKVVMLSDDATGVIDSELNSKTITAARMPP